MGINLTGYVDESTFTVKAGDEVLIPKDIDVVNTYLGYRKNRKVLKVRVKKITNGEDNSDGTPKTNPRVYWIGGGRNLCYADMKDVQKVTQ